MNGQPVETGISGHFLIQHTRGHVLVLIYDHVTGVLRIDNTLSPNCERIDVACATKVLPRPPYLERLFTDIGTYKTGFIITMRDFGAGKHTL